MVSQLLIASTQMHVAFTHLTDFSHTTHDQLWAANGGRGERKDSKQDSVVGEGGRAKLELAARPS